MNWKNEPLPQLILGTVQLGMPYGIANVAGQPDRAQARYVLQCALRHDIRHFDTAQAYGESESVLGEAFESLGVSNEVKITTKLAAALDPTDASSLEAALEQSFARLRVDRLWCLLLHQPAWLNQWEGPLGEVLGRYRASGRIAHLGVSCVSANDGHATVRHPGMEVLQIPCNAWDRRAAEDGILAEARRLERLCCVRSIYLQGLLTLTPEAAAAKLPAAAPAAHRWHEFAQAQAIAPVELAMRYALTLQVPLVVGAESANQIAETVRLSQLPPLPPDLIAALRDTMDPVTSLDILEPTRWPAPNPKSKI